MWQIISLYLLDPWTGSQQLLDLERPLPPHPPIMHMLWTCLHMLGLPAHALDLLS